MAEVDLPRWDPKPELGRFSFAALARFYRERFAMSISVNLA